MSLFLDGDGGGGGDLRLPPCTNHPRSPPSPGSTHQTAGLGTHLHQTAARALLFHLHASDPSMLQEFQTRYAQAAAEARRSARTAETAVEVALPVNATALLLSWSPSSSLSSSGASAAAAIVLSHPERVGAALGPLLAADPSLPVRAHVRLLRPPLPLVTPDQAQEAVVSASSDVAAAARAAGKPTTAAACPFGGGGIDEPDGASSLPSTRRASSSSSRLLVSVLGTVCAVAPARRLPAVRRLACARCGAAQVVDGRLPPSAQLAECCPAACVGGGGGGGGDGAAFDAGGWAEDVAGRYDEPRQVVWLTGVGGAACCRPPLAVVLSGSDLCGSLPLGAAVHVVGHASVVPPAASLGGAALVTAPRDPAAASVVIEASSAGIVKLAALRWAPPGALMPRPPQHLRIAGSSGALYEKESVGGVGRALAALDAALGGPPAGLDAHLAVALMLSAAAAGDDCVLAAQTGAPAQHTADRRSQLHLLVLPRLRSARSGGGSGWGGGGGGGGLYLGGGRGNVSGSTGNINDDDDRDDPSRLLQQAAELLSPSHARLSASTAALDGGAGVLPSWAPMPSAGGGVCGAWAASRLWLASSGVAVLPSDTGALPARALRPLADAALLRGAASADAGGGSSSGPSPSSSSPLERSSDHALGLIVSGGGGKKGGGGGAKRSAAAAAAVEGVVAPMSATLWTAGGDDAALGVAWPPPSAAASAWEQGVGPAFAGVRAAAAASASCAAAAAAASGRAGGGAAAGPQLPASAFDLVLRLRKQGPDGAGGSGAFRAALFGSSQSPLSAPPLPGRRTYRRPDPSAAAAVRALIGAAAARPPHAARLSAEAAALLSAYAAAAGAHGVAGAAGEGGHWRLLGLLARLALASARVFGAAAGGGGGGGVVTATEARDATLAIVLADRSLADRAEAAAVAAAASMGRGGRAGGEAAAAAAAEAARAAAASLIGLPAEGLGSVGDADDGGASLDARLALLHGAVRRALSGGDEEDEGDEGDDGARDGDDGGGFEAALRDAQGELDY